MKTKIKWRLSNLPDPSEVTELLKAGILTKDEAREILISLETEEDRSKKSLQDEIKFLRELVAKMSTNHSVIIETIREVQKPYYKYDWWTPYQTYTTTANALNTTSLTGGATQANYSLSSGTGSVSGNAQSLTVQDGSQFTDIKTF